MSSVAVNRGKGATAAGTRVYCDTFVTGGQSLDSYRRFGRTGLTVSAIGFGGYRAVQGNEDHRDALARAIAQGCNLIDTSTNYGDGSSESLVGEVVDMISHAIPREQIIVVSKAGYIQGSNLKSVKAKASQGQPYPEVVEYSPGCWHCIHPEFLADQLELTLGRLKLDTLDVFLLHNPEYFLLECAKGGGAASHKESRDVFYDRIKKAFEWLETQVENGKIGAYGVSSNTFVRDANVFEATSVSRMVEIAHEIAGDGHHFSVIQLPMNLMEPGGTLVRNTGEGHGQTALEAALDADLAVLTNRPLNALVSGDLVRLSDFDITGPSIGHVRAHKTLSALEDEFAEGLGRVIEGDDGNGDTIFRFARALEQAASQIDNVLRWDEYFEHMFSPEVNRRLESVDNCLSGPIKAAWHLWLERYVDALNVCSACYRARCARTSQKISDRISKQIAPFVPEANKGASLSQKSVALLKGVPGVTTVLVGMRMPAYVTDISSVLRWPAFTTDIAVFNKVTL